MRSDFRPSQCCFLFEIEWSLLAYHFMFLSKRLPKNYVLCKLTILVTGPEPVVAYIEVALGRLDSACVRSDQGRASALSS